MAVAHVSELIEWLRGTLNDLARSVIRDMYVLSEDRDSVRSPGWYEALCLVPACEWMTTGRESVADDAARSHVIEFHHDQPSLSWVKAARRILDEVVPAMDRMENVIESEWGSGDEGMPESERLVRLLALPLASWPGYREEWRP